MSGGYRDKMRDECVAILSLLLKSRTIRIPEIVRRTGVKERTVRRWLHSYSLLIPLEIHRGRVTVLDGWDLVEDSPQRDACGSQSVAAGHDR